jgi:hypothetical protein
LIEWAEPIRIDLGRCRLDSRGGRINCCRRAGSNADVDVVLVRERIQSGGAARIIRRRRAAS